MKCMRIDCDHEATKTPVISFASVQKPGGPRVTATLNLMVCDLHASCDPNEFVSDKGWQQIVDTLKLAGKAFPSRETLRVTFNPL